GSFQADSLDPTFSLRWDNITNFHNWLREEQERKCIELRLAKTFPESDGMPHYLRKYRYVCARKGTGGEKKYEKKYPERERKLPSKRTGCECTLTVKEYPGTTTLLGAYKPDHNHEIFEKNLRFTHVPKEVREYI
ncbi:hypothetical protein FB45DRAFT_1142717, partial [Roridomyces roridus]